MASVIRPRRRSALTAVAAVTIAVAGLISGSGTAAAVPSATGVWSAPFQPAGSTSRVIGVHSILLHTGKVLLFGNLKPTVGYVYDPVTGSTVQSNPPADVECGAATPLADGRILVVGGFGTRDNTGIVNILLFDPSTLTWTPQPSTSLGRYYPTATRLADGRVLLTGGFTTDGSANDTVEVYTPPPPGKSVGTLQAVGTHHNGIYARQWLLPDGRVLEATAAGSTFVLAPATWTWTRLAGRAGNQGTGQTAALLPGSPAGSTRVIFAGGIGTTTAVNTVSTFNAATSNATWQTGGPLPTTRGHMSPVLLPDGSLLGIGGNASGLFDQPQKTAMLYQPASGTWTTLAAQTQRRAYHSTAVLLPDGRVLSAGDTGADGGLNTDEIFSPPYLYKGARPSVSSAPSQVGYGTTFTIGTTAGTSRAVLMAPGAATHTSEMNARNVALRVTAVAGGLQATVPSRNVAPSGWYMLFLVTPEGVPSTAKWMHLG